LGFSFSLSLSSPTALAAVANPRSRARIVTAERYLLVLGELNFVMVSSFPSNHSRSIADARTLDSTLRPSANQGLNPSRNSKTYSAKRNSSTGAGRAPREILDGIVQ
jgi:hypothetical protein